MLEERTARVAGIVLFALEVVTIAILTFLTAFSILGLLMEIPAVVRPPFLGAGQLAHIVDHILAVFILIELLALAMAYVRRGDTVRRIFEAMLVALARKLISIDLAVLSLEKVAGLSLLLVALGLAWFLFRTRRRRAAQARG